MTNSQPLTDLPLGKIFKVVLVGWACGLMTLFSVPILMIMLFGPQRSEALIALVLLPLAAFGQGIFAGVMVVVGVAVYRSWRGRFARE